MRYRKSVSWREAVKNKLQLAVMMIATTAMVAAAGCSGSGKPSEAGLRDSFAQQVAKNKFIKDFKRNGDELTFTGPGAEGGTAKWRVHIDSTLIEDTSNPLEPYQGTVKSSWYSNDQLVRPRGRESGLPPELIDNGVAQDCWALWDKEQKKWGWD